MCVKTFDTVTGIEVFRRILSDDNIYGSPHRRAAKPGRYHSFVDFDSVDHVYRYVIDIDEVWIVIHRATVYEKADAFSL